MAIIDGTNGDDTLYGSANGDSLYAGDGNDMLKGFGSADRLEGGNGIDTAFYTDSSVGVTVNLDAQRGYYGTAAGDWLISIENLYGSYHNDVLIGTEGANAFYGLNGNDVLIGGGGDDTLDGGAGDDTLKGGGGSDHLVGGLGNDTADYSQSPVFVFVELDDDPGIYGDAQGDTFSGIENITGSAYSDNLNGDDGANVLRGMNGNDTLIGEGGDDRLYGGLGNDRFEGGSGSDTMVGGLGNDLYIVNDVGDAVTESGGQGIDEVYTTMMSYVLPSGADIEILRAEGGLAAIELTGNSSGNFVIGNNGNNILNGGDGNDELRGRDGQDSFLFDTALDAAFNVDVITDFSVADDTIRLDQTIFSSALGLGNIEDGEFVIGAAAQDVNDRIIYNGNTGALFYDNDGVGGNAQVQFATLTPGLALTHLDFLVV